MRYSVVFSTLAVLLAIALSTPSLRAEPKAALSTPALASCVCRGTSISVTGLSFDTTPGAYINDRLEFSPGQGTGPWTLIGVSTTPVSTLGFLSNFNTAPLEPGVYTLRLTVISTTGTASATTSFVLQHPVPAAPAITLRNSGMPTSTSFIRTVCGEINKSPACAGTLLTPSLELKRVGHEHWTPIPTVDRGSYVSFSIDAATLALTTGEYDLRASIGNTCGQSASSTQRVTIFNDPPEASPLALTLPPCGVIAGPIIISGTVDAPDLMSWSIVAQRTGGSTLEPAVVLASGDTPKFNFPLAFWDTTQLAPCSYTLTLSVTSARLEQCGSVVLTQSYSRSVDVGCPADFNRSGIANIDDLFAYLNAFFSPCQ